MNKIPNYPLTCEDCDGPTVATEATVMGGSTHITHYCESCDLQCYSLFPATLDEMISMYGGPR